MLKSNMTISSVHHPSCQVRRFVMLVLIPYRHIKKFVVVGGCGWVGGGVQMHLNNQP